MPGVLGFVATLPRRGYRFIASVNPEKLAAQPLKVSSDIDQSYPPDLTLKYATFVGQRAPKTP